MAQHMLLVYVAAPLFLLSAPMMLLLGSLDLARARRLGRFLHSPFWRSLTFPVFTWLFFMAVMWGAHFSPLYELALAYPAVHILEHALFLTSAILFWQAIIHIGPVSWPMNFPLRVVYVFLAMPQGAFLGLALYQTRMALYPHYVVTHGGSVAAALARSTCRRCADVDRRRPVAFHRIHGGGCNVGPLRTAFGRTTRRTVRRTAAKRRCSRHGIGPADYSPLTPEPGLRG